MGKNEILREFEEEMKKRVPGLILDFRFGEEFLTIFFSKEEDEEALEIRIPLFIWKEYDKEKRKNLYDFLEKYLKGELEEKFVKDLYLLLKVLNYL